MCKMPSVELAAEQRRRLADLVVRVLENCPGQTEFRYLAYLRQHMNVTGELRLLSAALGDAARRPLLLGNLPQFDDVERSKILCLLLGEAVGTCVAYADYNASYITDIRATVLSTEKSSGVELLSMHNDLSWAGDDCRPRLLVLAPHVADGCLPSTLFAPSREVVDLLSDSTKDVLRQPLFEARSGSALSWGHERVQRMALLEEHDGRPPTVRLNFGTFTPAADLSSQASAQASKAMHELIGSALKVGRRFGRPIRKGEAVMIPNDHCLHGRDPVEPEKCERLLLRAYVLPDAIAELHGSSMIRLGA